MRHVYVFGLVLFNFSYVFVANEIQTLLEVIIPY